MTKYMRYFEKPVVRFEKWSISATKVGYLICGPGINMKTTTLYGACIELAEHIARVQEIDVDGAFSVTLFIERLEQVYIKIRKDLHKDIVAACLSSGDLHNEERESEKPWS